MEEREGGTDVGSKFLSPPDWWAMAAAGGLDGGEKVF